MVVDIPVFTQRRSPWSCFQKTIEIPQLVGPVVGVPVVRSYRFSRAGRRYHPCCDAETGPHGPSDHGDSAVVVH